MGAGEETGVVMSEKKRKVFTGEFKAKVALGGGPGPEDGQRDRPGLWRPPDAGRAMEKGVAGAGGQPVRRQARGQAGGAVGQPGAAVLRDRAAEDGAGLAEKKVRDQPLAERKGWIGAGGPLPLARQCELAGVARSTVYAPRKAAQPDAEELALLALVDAEYTRHPFYGSRKMVVYLEQAGHRVNRKRVQRLMGILGLAGMAPGPDTSRPHPCAQGLPLPAAGAGGRRAPTKSGARDITYIRLARGFAYLVAVIDWYSRKVLAWRVSNTLDGGFCVDCLGEALRNHGTPEIFNSDQGCQFTSEAFTGVLKRAGHRHQHGRARAGLGQHLRGAPVAQRQTRGRVPEGLRRDAGAAARAWRITSCSTTRNGSTSRLDYQTPDEVYRTASGGGPGSWTSTARRKPPRTESKAETGQRCSAASDQLPS